jgi:hypothetical protein
VKTEFIVMTAASKMPSSCKGRYGRVAVLEVEAGIKPKMISERARGVVRVVALEDKCNIGGLDLKPPCATPVPNSRTAYANALRDATRLCEALNREARMQGEAESA